METKRKQSFLRERSRPTFALNVAPFNTKGVQDFTPSERSRNPIKDVYLKFRDTGAISKEDIEKLRIKYYRLSRSSLENKARNWAFFLQCVLPTNSQSRTELAHKFGLIRQRVADQGYLVGQILLQNDPLDPTEEYLEYIHGKYIEKKAFRSNIMDRNWDIWLRRRIQTHPCKEEFIGAVYNIKKSAVSATVRKMNDIMGELMDKYPECHFLKKRNEGKFTRLGR